MTKQSGPIYEVTFFVNQEIVGDLDRWLEEHVREALRIDGVVDCNTGTMVDAEDGRARRLSLFRLADDDALDRFLEGMGGDIDNAVADRFQGAVRISARILREDTREDFTGGSPDCLNCGAYLRGQYCAVCGQRSRSRLISLWELIADAFGDLFELDSRLWQTLLPLMVHPGRLTHDYLQGRRARYMPPFRMYLVLSLLFFVIAFFDPREDLSLLFEPPPVAGSEGKIQPGQLPEDLDLDDDGPSLRRHDDSGTSDSDCDVDGSDVEDLPEWLRRRFTPERLQRICERTQIDGGGAFVDKLLDNIPAALIVLLPIMAFVLKVLYPLSRRYYVEHLLFLVHFHAFFFLMLSLQILLVRLSTWIRIPEALAVLTVVVSSFYIPVYLFVAMRRVYRQGRIITILKYIVLLVAYTMGFTLTMLAAIAFAALAV